MKRLCPKPLDERDINIKKNIKTNKVIGVKLVLFSNNVTIIKHIIYIVIIYNNSKRRTCFELKFLLNMHSVVILSIGSYQAMLLT